MANGNTALLLKDVCDISHEVLNEGLPIYSRGALGRKALTELLEPSTWLPKSRITRDPWWYDYPSLRPYYSPLYYGRAPYYLRSSYLSPIKRTYLWGIHPLRPFTYSYFWE